MLWINNSTLILTDTNNDYFYIEEEFSVDYGKPRSHNVIFPHDVEKEVFPCTDQVSLGKTQPLVTSHDVTVLPCSNAAKLSCDLCGFEMTKTKPSKARQKLQAHVHAKHQDVIPQLDKDVILDGTFSLGNKQLLPVINDPVIDVPEASDVIIDTLEEVSNQISTQDHFPWCALLIQAQQEIEIYGTTDFITTFDPCHCKDSSQPAKSSVSAANEEIPRNKNFKHSTNSAEPANNEKLANH